MSLILGYDPETLREQVDLDACDARLAELGDQRSLQALLERVWLLKVLGRLEDALVISEESVRVARMAGTRKDLLRSRILHATINQWRGALAAAAGPDPDLGRGDIAAVGLLIGLVHHHALREHAGERLLHPDMAGRLHRADERVRAPGVRRSR